MRRPGWIRWARPPKAERQAPPGSRRDRLAVLLALVTVVCLASAFFLSKGTQVLMPGPLTSAHGAIENCSTCHTKSGRGKLSWIHGLVAGDPLADSKACLTCHKMPDTAFNAHSASADVLKQSTERLTKIAAGSPAPQSARAQSIAFPTHDIVARGLYCATCHQEHQGVNFNLNKISNEQCRSCHVVKFDSFDGHHPKFDNYPFKRRTRIIYDHAGHFGKHYPEVAKKDPERRIPATCSACHDSRDDKRIMAVTPFEQTCTSCHLNQIIGKERASGPKGIAFLTLPGLDLQTLKTKNASIGEWPDASEGALTPFMKVMISRNERGRALIKTVDSLNLQDLTNASDDQIKAVTTLAWEIKGLFYSLIKGRTSDVLGNLNIGGGVKLSAALVADLTASIPRDVVISAQQEWLPNLAAEMADRPDSNDQKQSDWSPVTTEPSLADSASPEERSGSDAHQAAPSVSPQSADSEAAGKAETAGGTTSDGKEALSADGSSSAPTESSSQGSESPKDQLGSDVRPKAKGREAARNDKLDPPACVASIFGQCLVYKEQKTEAEGAAGQTDAAVPKADGGKESISAGEQPGRMNAGVKYAENAGQPEEVARETVSENAGSDNSTETPSDGESGGAVMRRLPLPSGTPRGIEAQSMDATKGAKPEGAAGKADAANAKADGGKEMPAAGEQPQGKATDQSDDLLFPTEEELREIKARSMEAEKAGQPEGAAGKTGTANTGSQGAASGASKAEANASAGSDTAAAAPQTRAAPVVSIESDVDPESWAEYGGWYRQDYEIFYRPVGHKDKFIYAWLFLTGPQAPKGDASPAAAVFDFLTGKDAQGSCTKCHSVDDLQGKGRVVNFSPPSVERKQGRFTNFIHEPHFGILENRGCLTCHNLEKGRPYLKSYEQGNPQNFVSNFGAVKTDLCQTCHTSSKARQDCLLCHKYHVNGAATPTMSTKNPIQ